MDVAGYVLQPFRAAERGEVDTAISEALRVIDAILALGLDKALSGQRL
jgi:peptidyl-tRNA hydrolase